MIQRRSDKHSPRIDHELDAETASITHGAPVAGRSRSDLRQEDPAEESDARPSGELAEALGEHGEARRS